MALLRKALAAVTSRFARSMKSTLWPAGPIHRPVEIDPLATNLPIGLVNTPRLSRRCCEAVPALNELRREALYPAHDRRIPRGLPSVVGACASDKPRRSKCRPSNTPSRPFSLLMTSHQIDWIATLADPMRLFASEPQFRRLARTPACFVACP